MKMVSRVPYADAKVEYSRNITKELVERHKEEYREQGMKLWSAFLFGPLANGEFDDEIHLVEVVKGYPYPSKKPEPSAISFESTRQFPMFGHLRLWVLSPEELKEAVKQNHPLASELKTEPKLFFTDFDKFARTLLS